MTTPQLFEKSRLSHWFPSLRLVSLIPMLIVLLPTQSVIGQPGVNFDIKTLQNENILSGTSLEFGPDGRLYVTEVDGDVKIYTIERNESTGQYSVTDTELIPFIKNIPNHNDDGASSSAGNRQVTGITVVGTAANPVMYITSSDKRTGGGGGGGDANLDTNSGVITRATKSGSSWDVVDIVRGLPRSEENHATNGLEYVEINGVPHLIVCSGGFTNAGSPSNNFAFITEYALSGAVLAVNLSMIESMQVQTDPSSGRQYVYDLPTLDDPTRANVNGITDPDTPGYDGVDVGDPWGGHDGLNQAMLLPGEPVQMFSPGYRNTYDLVVTESGAVYVTDNGANGNWGGFPKFEATPNVNNSFRPGEPGSGGNDTENDEKRVNNHDHLNLVTTDIQSYNWLDTTTQVYGGHPCPVRANVNAGLFTRGDHTSDPNDTDGSGHTDGYFRTVPFDPNGSGDASNPNRALPANWPPVHPDLIKVANADYRQPDFDNSGNPTGNNDGPQDIIVVDWPRNTNAIDEYTASNFGGAMQGNFVCGNNQGTLYRVQLNPDGSAVAPNPSNPDIRYSTLVSNGIGGNPLGITCQGDDDPFPGTIWVANFNAHQIKILEPADFVACLNPGDTGYEGDEDYDGDEFTNDDEIANGVDHCSSAFTPTDQDGDKISNLTDPDDDNDGINDDVDPLQFGQPFTLPIYNEFRSDEPPFAGLFDIAITGVMSNGNPNWEASIPASDILGGTSGIITMDPVGSGDALTNDQIQGYQFGVLPGNNNVFTIVGSVATTDLPNSQQSAGIFFGDGTQSDYIKVVRTNTNTLAVIAEVNDVEQTGLPSVTVSNLPNEIFLYFLVDPFAGTVQVQYSLDEQVRVDIGSPIVIHGNLATCLSDESKPVIVGLIANDSDPNDIFSVSFDKIDVFEGGVISASLTGNFGLQGQAQGASFQVPITVELFQPSDPNIAAYSYQTTATYNNGQGTFTVTGMTAGEYHVAIRMGNTLWDVQTMTLTNGDNTADFDTLLSGNADGDNAVTILDFSLLAATFNLSAGDNGYDPRADFNYDGQVSLADFSLLAQNFNTSGDTVPTGND